MYLLRSLFVVDGTHVFSHVSVLLSFADFSCQERSMTYTGLHARISVCSCLAVKCPDPKGVKSVVERKCWVASCKPQNARITYMKPTVPRETLG